MIKMKKIVFLAFALIFFHKNYAQKHFSAEILTGVGFNKNLTLVNESVENYNVFTTQVNANYQFNLYKKLFAETGLGTQWYFSSGDVGVSNFKATSLHLNVPFIISYPLFKKTSIGTGITIFNNKDFDDFRSKSNHNFRTSLTFKGNYNLNSNFSIVFKINHNLSHTPDIYLVNQSNTDILFGVSCKLF